MHVLKTEVISKQLNNCFDTKVNKDHYSGMERLLHYITLHKISLTWPK